MHIQYLKNFYDVATLKSISKVANISHISQSALSQQLSKLEEELGVPLLERSNKGVELTEHGELLLKHVRTIINAYDRILEDISSIKNKKDSFVISSSSSSIDSIILKILIILKDTYRNSFFKIKTVPTNQVELELINRFSDVALTHKKIEEHNNCITSLKIGSSELNFVANLGLDLNGDVHIDNIFKYPFILLGDGPEIKKSLQLALASKGYTINDLNIVFVANSIDIARNAVEQSQAISLLPKICVVNDINNGFMKKFSVKGFSFNYDIFFSYSNENYRVSRKLIDDFKKEVKRLLR